MERLRQKLDPGESEAIVLAMELDAVLLLDEKRGRRRVAALGIPRVGLGGLLVRTKGLGLIGEVRPILMDIVGAGYHLADSVIRDILRLAGEEP